MDRLTTQQSIPPNPDLLDDEDAGLDDGDVIDPGFSEAEPGIGNDVDLPDPETLPGSLGVVDEDDDVVPDRPL
ncbi:hypothetical protein AABC73_09560 [Pseudomonas sp. G.S.17]|uniref:hypothetical protein n=1 Tax=Pseudomonas sp. G.S.17 TaxID=3137451 RepID=UPI00311C99BF